MYEKKRIDVLVATMDQQDFSILTKMNIQSGAIIGNQSENNEIINFENMGHKVKFLSFKEKGVGLNRNNALMRSTADYCILADDDMIFRDGYPEIVRYYFEKIKKADVLIFNLKEQKASKRFVIRKIFRVKKYNFMRFGAARIVFKRERVTKKGIFFNLHFGGGTEFGSGEDTLFLHQILKNNLKVYAVPEYLAELTYERDSTWFNGYTEKFFIDKGALLFSLYPKVGFLLCLRFVLIKNYTSESSLTRYTALKLMLKGKRLIE